MKSRELRFVLAMALGCAASCEQRPATQRSGGQLVSTAGLAPGIAQSIARYPLLGFRCTPAMPGQNGLLPNAGFEDVDGDQATNWIENRWNGGTVNYSIVRGRDGGSAQRLTVPQLPSDGGVIFAQRFLFQAGIAYEGRIWLRSDDAATVQFFYRRQGPFYESMAVHRVTLTPTWQEFVIRGGWREDVPGYFGINFLTKGTVEVDDASLRQLTETDCVANGVRLPSTFMGMTVNKWPSYNTWPSDQQFGLLRLWDTVTRWEDLEPTKGAWDWLRMDLYVSAARRANEEVLYTLGMTPVWAAARRAEGHTSEPANIADWRNYVRTVATRYRGRIKYWEIWNEVNYGGFYTGSVDAMLELTRAASEELKAVDPTNVVLSPNISAYGFQWLDEFLAKGGGAYVDIISWHLYTNYHPEQDEPMAMGLRDVLARRGLSDRPIWNTEGNTDGVPPNATVGVGGIARAYLVQPWWGHSNFSFYCWDIDYGNPISQPGYLAPTAAGIAYREVGRWLTGSTMLGRRHLADGTWEVTMQLSDGRTAYALWNDTSGSFAVPAGWGVTTVRDLSGRTQAISSSSVTVGPAPILLLP